MAFTDEQLIVRPKYKQILKYLFLEPILEKRIRFKHLKILLCTDSDKSIIPILEGERPVFKGKKPTSELYNHLKVLENKNLIEKKKDKGKYYYYIPTIKVRFIFVRSQTKNFFNNLIKDIDVYYKGEMSEVHTETLNDLMRVITIVLEDKIGVSKG